MADGDAATAERLQKHKEAMAKLEAERENKRDRRRRNSMAGRYKQDAVAERMGVRDRYGSASSRMLFSQSGFDSNQAYEKDQYKKPKKKLASTIDGRKKLAEIYASFYEKRAGTAGDLFTEAWEEEGDTAARRRRAADGAASTATRTSLGTDATDGSAGAGAAGAGAGPAMGGAFRPSTSDLKDARLARRRRRRKDAAARLAREERAATRAERRRFVLRASLAEQMQRCDEMRSHMRAAFRCAPALRASAAERDLFFVACKGAVAARRTAFQRVADMEDVEKQMLRLASRAGGGGGPRRAEAAARLELVRGYKAAIAADLRGVCEEVFDVVAEQLRAAEVPDAEDADDVAGRVVHQVLWLKLNGDYARYLSEVRSGKEREGSAMAARQAYLASGRV